MIFILLGIRGYIKAQSPQYRQYTVNDGLPSAIVYNMIQDRYGYMWFATENGLARFEGKTFKTFTRNDGLTDNLILRLYEDKKGRIWITSFTGKLCYYLDGKIHNPGNDSLLSRMPYLGIHAATAPVVEKDGILYFGNRGSFFALKDNKIYSPYGKKSGTANDRFLVFPVTPDYSTLQIDSNPGNKQKDLSGYYPYERKGYYYAGASLRNILKKASLPLINTIQYQKQIKEDLWFTSSDNGAFRISGLGPDKIQVKQYLEGIVVNDVFLDNENNLWFSTTGKGLFLLAGNSKNSLQITKSDELPQENINVLYRDQDHVIWAGAINNYLYRLKNLTVVKYYSSQKKGLINYCYDVVGNSNGDIYYANNEDLVTFKSDKTSQSRTLLVSATQNPSAFIKYGNYKSLSVNADGKVIATTPFRLLIYEPHTALGKKNLMRVIPSINGKRLLTSFITSSGKIWVANSEGLYSVEGDKWTEYYSRNKVLKEPISRIVELNDGNLLITTRSKGIILFDGNNVKQVFSEPDGLASDICNRVFVDINNVWVATARGVSKLLYRDGRLNFIRNYSTDDGLLSNEINDISADHDTIYVATAEGLTILPDAQPVKTPPPSVYINSVQYGSSVISGSRDTVLKYAHDYVRFNFIGITYQQPQKIVYKYRLRGSNDSWETNSSGTVDYPALMPGDYVFEVMAKKTDSDWSLPKTFHFIIKAPFWMKTWFYFLIYGLLLMGLGFAVYLASRLKRKQSEKKFALQNRMAQLEQQALSALMNPHFIFNALNSIQQYLHQNNALAANKYLSLFAKLTRQNMEAVVKNSISIEEELERLELYLNLEKLRFGDKLQYHIDIPADLETDEIAIPPMVLQPFVENAIWHGIMPLSEGGQIFISAKKINDSQCLIEIRDTGMGIDASRELKKSQGLTHNSKGMQLTIERLELWAKGLNVLIDLKIIQGEPVDGGHPGTVIRLILPVPE